MNFLTGIVIFTFLAGVLGQNSNFTQISMCQKCICNPPNVPSLALLKQQATGCYCSCGKSVEKKEPCENWEECEVNSVCMTDIEKNFCMNKDSVECPPERYFVKVLENGKYVCVPRNIKCDETLKSGEIPSVRGVRYINGIRQTEQFKHMCDMVVKNNEIFANRDNQPVSAYWTRMLT